MPPKLGERKAASPHLNPAAAPKSPKCSPKLAPNAPSSPLLKPLHAANTRVVIHVPIESVGVVIGKEGRTLHRIERMFSVTIRVTKDSASPSHELCIVEGSDAGSVAMCEAHIISLYHPEFELLLPDDGVVIPKRLSGRLIGARGSNKEMFEKNSGAVIEYDEVRTKILIKGTQKAVATAALLVRKFISEELLPKRKLSLEEQSLVSDADKAGIHLNTNQLDTFSKCLKEAYVLALKSFAAEDSQFSVIMKKQAVKWTWRLCDDESALFEEVPLTLALELERFHIDESDGAVLCLPDNTSFDISLSAMLARNLVDGTRYQLQRSCASPAPQPSRSAASSRTAASSSSEADAKTADLCHRLMQFGFQHREITICLRNGSSHEQDALICALTDLQACTWLSNSAAQSAKKSGGAAVAPSSGGLVPMFVKPQQELQQKTPTPQSSSVSTRRAVVLDGSNIALRHGFAKAFSCKGILAALNWFHGKGHEVYVVVPQSRLDVEPALQRPPCVDHHILVQLREQGRVVPIPGYRSIRSGAHLLPAPCDDRFILELASRAAAVVVSNDSFNDLKRLISFTFAGDMFVPVEDAHPLESLLMHETQPLSITHANGASPPVSPLIASVGVGGAPSVPSEWICPLSNKIMSDPVTASDGVNYDRRALCDWLKESNVSPATGSRLTSKSYVDNNALKEEIRLFVSRKGSSAVVSLSPLE